MSSMPRPAFKNGVALVAGGTGGFGQAICEAFALQGTAVAFTYRSRHQAAEQLQAHLSAIGVDTQCWALDLNDFDRTEAVLAQVRARFGAIHSVVYAAGPRTDMDYVSKLDPQRVASILHDDVVGFFHLARAALPLFKFDGGGSIPMNRLGQPEEIADAVVYLASERASFVTGTALSADGGQHL